MGSPVWAAPGPPPRPGGWSGVPFTDHTGHKREVTSHAQNVQGHDCMFMHILTRGSDPIVALTVDGRRCRGRRAGCDGRRSADPALPQPRMLRSRRLVGARLHPSCVGDEPRLPSACRAAQARTVLGVVQPARCAPSAPASPKGLRTPQAGGDHRAAYGGGKALLPSCGRLLSALVARALAVCRRCLLLAWPDREVAPAML